MFVEEKMRSVGLGDWRSYEANHEVRNLLANRHHRASFDIDVRDRF